MANANQNEPYSRTSRGTWAIWHDSRQITLGKDKAAACGIWGLQKSGLDIETARAKWTLLQAGGTESRIEDRGPTLESLLAVSLDWCQKSRSESVLVQREMEFRQVGVSELSRTSCHWVLKYPDCRIRS